MDFRRKSTSSYAHFVFYPNSNMEGKAVRQCMFVRDSLKEIFTLEQVSFLIGAHLFCCYKQCGYKDDDVDCLREVSTGNLSGRFPAGKCHILPDAQGRSTSDNHLHILVYVPILCLQTKEPPVNSVSQQHVKPEKALKMEMDQTSQVGARATSSSSTQDVRPEVFASNKTLEECSPAEKNYAMITS